LQQQRRALTVTEQVVILKQPIRFGSDLVFIPDGLWFGRDRMGEGGSLTATCVYPNNPTPAVNELSLEVAEGEHVCHPDRGVRVA